MLFKYYFKIFIYFCLHQVLVAALGSIIIAGHGLFVVAQGLLSVSTCGAQAPELASSVVGHGLSCPEAHGILWLPW